MPTESKTCADCGREGTRGFMLSEDEAVSRCVNRETCLARALKVARAANAGRCVDCVAENITTDRKIATDRDGRPRPGPRCVTHWRARRKVVRHNSHAKRTEKNFGLTAEQYWALYALQGGKCFGCRRATGKTKRLAVDHDHELAKEHDHPVEQGCPYCVRCLLCGQCNQILGRYDVLALLRLIEVLTDPPARRWLNLE